MPLVEDGYKSADGRDGQILHEARMQVCRDCTQHEICFQLLYVVSVGVMYA